MLLIVLIFVTTVSGFSDGAGDCTTPGTCMTAHAAGEWNLTSTPSYKPGENINVTLSSVGGAKTIAGFLLYAESDSGARVGTWRVDANMQLKTGCTGSAGATLTHTNYNGWGSSHTFTYTPPATGGSITFRGIGVYAPETWEDLPASTSFSVGVPVTFTGLLGDNLCIDAPGSIAVDGANMRTGPENHTVGCMIKIPACYNSGFSVLSNQGTAASPDYARKYRFDANGNAQAIKLLNTTTKTKNYYVTVTGTLDAASPSTMNVTTLAEATPPPSSTPTPTPESPSTPSVPAPVSAPGDPDLLNAGYTYYMHLECNSVYWKPYTPGNPTVSMAVRGKSTGWVAVGFPQSSALQMVGSDAILGWVDSTGTSDVKAYRLNAQIVAGVNENTNLILTNVSGTEISGTTTIYFTRILNGTGFNQISDPSSVNIIGTVSDGNDGLAYHTCRSSAVSNIDLISGAGTEGSISVYDILRSVHGSLMAFGFGLLLPCGLLVARYGRKAFPKGKWFLLHQILQTLGLLSAIGGFVIAFVMVNGSHFTTLYHEQFGVAIFGLLVIQFIYGVVRPDHAEEGERKTTCRKIFEVLHPNIGRILLIASTVNIFTGISLWWPFWVFIIYGLIVLIMILFAVTMELKKCFCSRDMERL